MHKGRGLEGGIWIRILGSIVRLTGRPGAARWRPRRLCIWASHATAFDISSAGGQGGNRRTGLPFRQSPCLPPPLVIAYPMIWVHRRRFRS